MSNPFKKITKNAENSKKEWDSVRTSADAKTKQCDGCGAPRPKGTDLTICNFCGGQFMEIDVEVKADK
jgi:hypothetical protein